VVAGKILAEMVENGRVKVADGLYTLVNESGSDALTDEKNVKKAFFEALHRGGGSNFESYVAKLLHKHFTDTGKRVLRCEAVGGSADGGIDVHAVTVDALGFYENIMVQTKCRRTQHVTEKEVREFYGAINMQDASRGIYVTTSVFHGGATKLLDSLPNCVGIDGEKLFALAKQTGVGVSIENGKYTLDLALLEGKN
jgi:restriction endonuclease Mrr